MIVVYLWVFLAALYVILVWLQWQTGVIVEMRWFNSLINQLVFMAQVVQLVILGLFYMITRKYPKYGK